MSLQLDLFISEVDLLREEQMKVKISADNVRRGMFARHNVLEKKLIEQEKISDMLKNEIESLKELVLGNLIRIA